MPVPERGVPAGAVVLLGVVLAVGAYVGWYRLSGEGRLPAETSIQVPTRLAPLAEQAVPPNVPQPPACGRAAPTPPRPPANAVGAAGRCAAGAGRLAQLGAAAAVPAAVACRLPPRRPDQPRIVLRASADAWVQVRDRAGPVLLNRILHRRRDLAGAGAGRTCC